MKISEVYSILERDRRIALTCDGHRLEFFEEYDEWVFIADGDRICFAPDLESAMDCLETEFGADGLERVSS